VPSIRAQRRQGVRLSPAFDAWFVKSTAIQVEDRFDRASDAVAALAEALGLSLPRGSRSSYASIEAPPEVTQRLPDTWKPPLPESAIPVAAAPRDASATVPLASIHADLISSNPPYESVPPAGRVEAASAGSITAIVLRQRGRGGPVVAIAIGAI